MPISGWLTTHERRCSTFELPEYIHSRLQPQILIDFPERTRIFKSEREFAVRRKTRILTYVTEFLQAAPCRR